MLPRIRADLAFFPDPEDPERTLVKDPIRLQFHRFNQLHRFLIEKLDGRSSLEQLQELAGDEFGIEVPIEKIDRFVDRLRTLYLLDVSSYSDGSEPKALGKVRRRLWRSRRLFSRSALFAGAPKDVEAFLERARLEVEQGDPCLAARELRLVLDRHPGFQPAATLLAAIHEAHFESTVPLIAPMTSLITIWNPDRFLGLLDRAIGGFVFSGLGLLAVAVAILVGLSTLHGFDLAGREALDRWDGLAFFALALLSLFLHELGHGFALRHYGGNVTRMGIVIFSHHIPGAVTDVSDKQRMTNRWHKLIIDLGGIYSSALVTALLLIAYNVLDETFPLRDAVGYGVLFNLVAIISNLPPYMAMDGYLALSDHLGVPDLREQASTYFRDLAVHHLGAGPSPDTCPVQVRRVFFWYGLGGVVFGPALFYYFWLTGLFPWLVDQFGAVGLLFGLSFTFRIGRSMLEPIGPMLRAIWTNRAKLSEPERLVIAGPAVALLALLLAWPRPHYVDGRLELQPVKRSTVRAVTAGVIEKITVREGQKVEEDQVIATLRNPVIEASWHRAVQRLEEAELELAILESPRPEEVRVAQARAMAVQVARTFSAARARRVMTGVEIGASPLQGGDDARRAAMEEAMRAEIARIEVAEVRSGARSEERRAKQAEVELYRAEVREIADRRKDLEIRAPIRGIVLGTFSEPRRADAPERGGASERSEEFLEERTGEWLEAGDVLCEVLDASSVYGHVTLDASEPGVDVAKGRPVELRMRGEPHRAIHTQVLSLLPGASGENTVELTTEEFSGGGLLAGMTGHARIYGRQQSLGYQWLVLPILQLVDFDAWGELYGTPWAERQDRGSVTTSRISLE